MYEEREQAMNGKQVREIRSFSPDPEGRCKSFAAVVGMFDGVHTGHRYLFGELFRLCRERGLKPLLFTFPSHPLEIINPAVAPQLLSEPEEKLRLLEQFGFQREQVEFMVFDQELRSLTAREFLGMLSRCYGVSAVLRGFNNRFGTERGLTPDDYRRIGREAGVEVVDATEYRCTGDEFCMNSDAFSVDSDEALLPSSSEIRRQLGEGNIDVANRLLGYPYPLSGTVVTGKQLGRQLGFPTANIAPRHPSKLIPADGVYICTAVVGQPPRSALSTGREPRFQAMVNVGTCPTVDGLNRCRTIEAHILNFDADLYGSSITLEFLTRLRPEIRFPSVGQLRRQLEDDRQAVARFFDGNEN